MHRQVVNVLYVVAMAAVIVGVDLMFFKKPILGTADSEYWHRLGVRSVLLQIPEASMNRDDISFSLQLCTHTRRDGIRTTSPEQA